MQSMLLLLLASPFSEMIAAESASYVAARNRAIESVPLAEIEARIAESEYSTSTWREDVLIDALRFWMVRRTDAERAYALEGLQPERYSLRRRPEPEAARELVRLDAAPIAFEILLKTRELYAVRTVKERAALDDAIVLALGASPHPAAPHALMAIAKDDAYRASLRELAASQLRSEPQLIELLADPILRRGAVIGLGQVRTIASVRALVRASRDPALRLPAIRALGSAASPFVLRRTRNPQADAIRSEAIAALESMSPDPEHALAVKEALSIVRGSRLR